jgi:signal transduction histidine kinase
MNRPQSVDVTQFETQFELPAAKAPAPASLPPSTAQLTVLVGPQVGHVYALGQPVVTLGRAADVDIRLQYTAVSRAHARIHLLSGGRVDLEDLNSSNGTFINDQRVVGRRALRNGDRVRLGTRVLLQFAVVDHHDRRLREIEKLEVVSQLSTAVNHDLNNLLSVLTCGISYLATLDPKCQLGSVDVVECLQDMHLAAQKAGELTHRLNTLVRRPDSAVNERVDVSELCDEVVRMLKRILPPGIQLEPRIARCLNVDGNRAWLHQLLMNPCINSRDAMADSGTLRFEARPASPSEVAAHPELESMPYVLISIADTGHGIPAEIISRVFQPYYTTKGAGRGTGLGLATVARVAREHGGSVFLASEPGKGTTLQIFLPKSRGAAVTAAVLEPKPEAIKAQEAIARTHARLAEYSKAVEQTVAKSSPQVRQKTAAIVRRVSSQSVQS